MAHASVVDSFSFIELHRYEDITLDDTFGAILDQQFLLFSRSLPMIGPEEYAEKTGTQTDAVRQAIRRGKIKNARKVGKDWRIPRLAMYEIFRTYSRPYTYYWFGQLNDIPQKYDYLNNYSGLSIYTGDKELGDFGIVLCRPGEKKADTIFMSKSEKETLETILIGNPNIYYMFDIGHMLTERVKEVK